MTETISALSPISDQVLIASQLVSDSTLKLHFILYFLGPLLHQLL